MTAPILRVGEEPKPLRSATMIADAGGRKRRTRDTSNRFATLNAFCDLTLAGLSRGEMAVWLLLWRDTKPQGTARTSQADLARRAGIDPRSVRRAIDRLAAAGLLTVVHRGGLRRGLSTYRVHPVDKPP